MYCIECPSSILLYFSLNPSGAGGNPENVAIEGMMRSLALRNVVMGASSPPAAEVQFDVSPEIGFCNEIKNAKVLSKYKSVLRYMFIGGSVGQTRPQACVIDVLAFFCSGCFSTKLDNALQLFGVTGDDVGVSIDEIHLYGRVKIPGPREKKQLCTYLWDRAQSRKCATRRGCTPRVGSNAIVEGIDGISAVRICVSVFLLSAAQRFLIPYPPAFPHAHRPCSGARHAKTPMSAIPFLQVV